MLELKTIGIIDSPFKEKLLIPRQFGLAPSIQGRIVMSKEYSDPDFFRGLENFSHIWVSFIFHQHLNSEVGSVVRPPRLGGNQKMGLFATRSPVRPNYIGNSILKLNKIEFNRQTQLHVSGLDLLDQTPIIDIRPVIKEELNLHHTSFGWTENVQDENKQVMFSNDVQIDENLKIELTELLRLNPKPKYQDSNKIYGAKYDQYEIKWITTDDVIQVISVNFNL